MLKRAALAVALLWTGASTAFGQAGPVQLLLIVDRSASMSTMEGAFPRTAWIRNGVLSAINELPRDARIGIVAFDARAEVVMPMQTYDRFAIQRALDALVPGEGGDLAAGLVLGLELLAGEEPGDRIVIVLTDAVPASGDFEALGEAYRAAGATVFPTILGPSGDLTLRPLATATGGRYEAFFAFQQLDGLMRTEVLDWRDALAARRP
ncbi:MAG: VWA domain-containing protein [Bauldia sp.]|nr:VWA domain-containing protein [Bauldia sp.]